MGSNYYFVPKGFEQIDKLNQNLDEDIKNIKEEYLKELTVILNNYKDNYKDYADLLYLKDISDLEDRIEFKVFGLDIPDIHICKISAGWNPLFELNRLYSNFKEFEDFYSKHKDNLYLVDEYDNTINFDDFKQKVFEKINNKNNKSHLQYNGNYGINYYKDELGVEWLNSHFS